MPLRENPDKYGNRKHQPEYKFRRTEAEIKREFQGYRFDKNPSEGNCKNPHGKWEDDLVVRIYVVATFDEARMKWVRQMKRRLERRFKQWEIYVTFSPIKEI